MSTRSLNIIKQNGKLLIFWMHWDGYAAADVILNWTDDERNYALSTIRNGGCSVACIHTLDYIKRRIKRGAELLVEAIAECSNSSFPFDSANDMLKARYVNLNSAEYDAPELGVYECDANTFGEITDLSQVLQRILELTGKHFIGDIQIGNIIDFDTQVCRFEYDFDNWSDKKNRYVEHHVSFAKAFPFSKVKKYGAEYAMGVRHRRPSPSAVSVCNSEP